MTLKLAIEDAVRDAAPDVTSILVEGEITNTASAPAGLSGALPLVTLESNTANRRVLPDDVVWEEILALDALPAGGVGLFPASDRGLLCCRLDDTFYAYGDHCPACGERLEAATLTGTTLQCAICGQAYDVIKAGRGLDRPDLHLEPFPLLREHGRARVALPMIRMASGSV
jgi:nitrite reductase/ring-hydroxylating ferredoxin subunit